MARGDVLLCRPTLPAIALALALAACASLKEAPDSEADGGEGAVEGGAGGGAEGGAGIEAGANADGGPGAAEAGAGNGDPRWPQWPMPADAPTSASYTLTNGPDGAIVNDKVTGLGWQDTVPTTARDFDGATAYCDGLVYDGLSDWRLPTRIETISVMVFAPVFGGTKVTGPAFSSVAGAQCFWTSSLVAGSPNGAYAANTATVSFMLKDSTCAARCVRGGPAVGTPVAKQFVATADTVTDPVTGLIWEKAPPELEGKWENADARCKALVLGGRAMRLPGVKELASIVDETKSEPSSSGVFGEYAVRMFTSNPQWTVRFTDGSASQGPIGFSYWSRCVASP